jgi:hypothetical protein
MGTSLSSAMFEALYEGILGIDIFFWLLGTIGQRWANGSATQNDEWGWTVGSLPWTLLLGVRPKTERVYLTPALVLQVPALLHLLFGGLALWLEAVDVYEVVTTICWLLIPWLGLIEYVVRGIRKKRTKVVGEKAEIMRDENAISEAETADDKKFMDVQEEEDEESPEDRRGRKGRRRKN